MQILLERCKNFRSRAGMSGAHPMERFLMVATQTGPPNPLPTAIIMKDNESMTNRPSPLPSSESRSRSALAEQSSKVMEDVRGLGSDVKSLGNAAVSSANEALQGVRKKGTEVLETGRERVTDARGGLEHYVQSNPLKSLLMAAGAGVLISIFMRR